MSTAPAVDRPDRARRGRARGIRLWLGLGMIAVGLGLLGYVAWQFYGTNWVSHREQASARQDLERQWHSALATASGSGGGSAKVAALRPGRGPVGRADAIIRIPAFGKSYAVPVFEGVGTDVLARGYGHFEHTAQPGEVGNYALAAHRVTHGEPLRNMPDLRPGDHVFVDTVDTTYDYVLDTDPNQLVIPFTGVWVLEPVPHNPQSGGVQPAQTPRQRLITLTTCSELFHTDNRMIAFGHLVGQQPRVGG